MTDQTYTPEEIEKAGRVAARLIAQLAEGKQLPNIAQYYPKSNLPPEYTLAMGQDGTVGIAAPLYHSRYPKAMQEPEWRIADDWTIGELIRFVLNKQYSTDRLKG